MAHSHNDNETMEGSQETFEKMLHERLQQAAAWHLLRDADDPQFLMKLFNACHIDMPAIHPGDKDEEHLLDASYTHARKALARRLDIDLSQFKQTRRCASRA